MRKIVIVLCLVFSIGLSACKSETEYGSCIGILDEPDPALIYRPSTRNIVLGAIFFQSIFAPALVVLKEHSCPEGRKPVVGAKDG